MSSTGQSHSGVREVAQLAGVSKSSVSNFFNKPDRLSAEMRAKIAAAVEALDFVPNDAARQLRIGDSGTIGVIAFETENPYFQVFAHTVEEEAERAGLFMLLATSNTADRERAYLDLFERQRVRGILIAPIGPVEERVLHIQRRGIPVVVFGHHSRHSEISSVSADNARGGALATEHLIDSGRTRLAFVGAGFDVPQVADRLSGALAAVSRHPGVTLEVIDSGERTTLAGHRIADAIVDRNARDRPDAVFAVNDLLAIGLEQGFLARGLSVPADIALIGYDDIEFGQTLPIPLSTIRQSHAELGRSAIELLLGGPSSARALEFQPELIVRESSAPLS